MNNTLISVITPVFNSEKTINETIESVINQTYLNWELILVDDGSTDQSIDVINNYCQKDNRIKLLIRDREPKGGSTCRNIGAFSANGEYLIFLDSDDLLSSTCLENRLEKIRNTKYKFIVFPMASFWNDVNNYNMFSDTTATEYLYYFACSLAPWQITSTFWRKDFFYDLNGFNEDFLRLQDVEIHLRAIIHSKNDFFYFKESNPDCYYRVPYLRQNNSISNKKVNDTIYSFNKFISLKNYYSYSFKNKYLNSVSNLMLVCNIYYLIDITDYAKEKRKCFNKVIGGFNIKKELLWFHKFVYYMINNIFVDTKINFFFIRVVKRILKRNF